MLTVSVVDLFLRRGHEQVGFMCELYCTQLVVMDTNEQEGERSFYKYPSFCTVYSVQTKI